MPLRLTNLGNPGGPFGTGPEYIASLPAHAANMGPAGMKQLHTYIVILNYVDGGLTFPLVMTGTLAEIRFIICLKQNNET